MEKDDNKPVDDFDVKKEMPDIFELAKEITELKELAKRLRAEINFSKGKKQKNQGKSEDNCPEI